MGTMTKTVKLTFPGPVHFGRGRLSDGAYTFDAATLFSALYIEALRCGTQDGLLEAARCGSLLLSDGFPYIKETLYLPKPMVAPETFDAANEAREGRRDSRERKANKKLSYVPAQRYADYLAGKFDSIAELGRFNLGEGSLQTKVNLTRSDGDDAKPYFVGGFSFAPGAGLYFIVQGDYDLEPLLEPLSYAGLGGKRTSGYGRFAYGVEDSDPLSRLAPGGAEALDASTQVLLASSAPREDELSDALLEGARYQLVRKGGFVQSAAHSASPRKKRDLYVFAAGSTFARRYQGDVYDVNATPGSHPVYRYAKAMWMEV